MINYDAYKGFNEVLGFTYTEQSPQRVEAIMPITDAIRQPFGVVHGGATISLLEAVASHGAALMTNFAIEVPFGIEANIRHRKSGKEGSIRAVATLNRIEGSKQVWDVVAYDDEGDVMSDGTFTTKIVSLERLAEIERRRAEAKAAHPEGA